MKQKYKFWFFYFLVYGLDFLLSAFTGIASYFLINQLSLNNYGFQFKLWLSIYIVATFIKLIFAQVAFWILQKYVIWIENTIRNNISKNLVNKSYANYNASETGVYYSWFINDANNIANNKYAALISIIAKVLGLLIYLGAIFYISWILGALTILYSFLIFGISFLYKKKNAENKNDSLISKENFLSQVTNVIDCFKIFHFHERTFCAEKLIDNSAREIKDNYLKWFRNLNRISSLKFFFLKFFSYISFILISLLTVYTKIENNQIGIVLFTTYFVTRYIFSFYSTSEDLVQYWFNKKINEKHLFPEIKITKKNNLVLNLTGDNNVTLKNVSVFYEDKTVLSNFNCSFNFKKKNLLVGNSGSGKSSLIKIIAGLNDNYKGDVYLNNENIKKIDSTSILNFMGFSDDSFNIVDGSLKDNITLFEEKSSQTRLEGALKFAELDEFSDLNYEINNDNLSAGQKQRINLARMYYFNPPLWILDESLASIDPGRTKKILKKLLSDKSFGLIYVSHHIKEESFNSFDQVVKLG